MHNFVNRITCNAICYMSVLAAQLNFKAILDTLLRKVYAIFLFIVIYLFTKAKLSQSLEIQFVNRMFFSNYIITNLSGALYSLSDNMKKSVKT